MAAIVLHRYSDNHKQSWNRFVADSKNATFLFDRRYMDYHSGRFKDHSLLIHSGKKLVAVFVANEDGNTIYSHGGLTYGGMALQSNARLEEVVSYFYHVVKYFHDRSFTSIVYKCVPPFLAKAPSFEDQYVLFLLHARIVKRETNCVISCAEPLPYGTNRRRSVKGSKSNSRGIKIVSDPTRYWRDVLEPNLLDRFGTKPVHAAPEMQLLMNRFPSNIKLYEIYGKKLEAGAVIYETPKAVHTQYLSATPPGKKNGALDFLIDHLINDVYKDKEYFSLGTSNENNGSDVNRGLMRWKEGFGARTWIHESYRIETKNFEKLSSYA